MTRKSSLASAAWPLVLVALVIASTLNPIADGDIWWHLAAGRKMVAQRGWLRVDPFTISAAGRPWPDLHWLFQLAVYGAYQMGGLVAIVVAKAALVGVGALVLFAAGKRHQPLAGWPVLMTLTLGAGVFCARHLVLARPVVFTLVFLALFLFVLEAYAAGAKPRVLYALPILQVVWVNTQGLFALGPAVIACWALGGVLAGRFGTPELPPRGGRTLAGILALTMLACVVTPFGVSALVLPLRLLGRLAPLEDNVFSTEIAENVSPLLLARHPGAEFGHFSWALALTSLSFLVARRRLHLGRAFVVLAFAGLACAANRNVLLFYWMAAPVVAWHLAPAVDSLLSRLPTWGRAASAVAPTVVLAVLVARAHAHETPIASPSPFRVPEGSVARLAQANASGRVFAADHYGGYIAWRLYPRYRPFIDTRLVLHTGEEYREFLGLLNHPERFDGFHRRQRFDHVILPAAFPDRYLNLIQHLAASPDWRLVFTDGSEVLFSRRDAANTGVGLDLEDPAVVNAIALDLETRLPGSTAPGRAARRHLARLLLLLGHGGRAEDVLTTLPLSDPETLALRARVRLLAGDLEAAGALAQQLMAATGDWPGSLDLLASIALARGDGEEALRFLRRSLAIDPFGLEANALLSRIEAEGQRAARAQ